MDVSNFLLQTRRGFLGTILSLGVAPAIVRADSLMRIIVPSETGIARIPEPLIEFADEPVIATGLPPGFHFRWDNNSRMYSVVHNYGGYHDDGDEAVVSPQTQRRIDAALRAHNAESLADALVYEPGPVVSKRARPAKRGARRFA